jgi:hypothetical protein
MLDGKGLQSRTRVRKPHLRGALCLSCSREKNSGTSVGQCQLKTFNAACPRQKIIFPKSLSRCSPSESSGFFLLVLFLDLRETGQKGIAYGRIPH